MRTWIRNWLGITDEVPETVPEKELRKEVIIALKALMTESHWQQYAMNLEWKGGATLFHKILGETIEASRDEYFGKAVSSYVKSEAFLDEIVERIKRKQL